MTVTGTGKLLLALPVVVGLGRGGEQEMPVSAEQPGWRNPHSKLPPGKSRNRSLCCSVSFCSAVTTPLSFSDSEAWGRHTPQNDAHKHRNTEFACRFREFGDPAPHSAHLWMP